jgi:hypothetical protein
MPNKLGMVIAERKGTLRLPEGAVKHVRVLIGRPKRRRGEEDYYCPFQVVGLAKEDVRLIVGCDSVQAIQLAFGFIGHIIKESAPPGSAWEDASENLGFPLPRGS